MSPHVAVTHYPEGAGHATRMMAVARGLEERGASVALAGGGAGRRFYGPNGYAAYEPPQVDYIEDYQTAGDPIRGLARVLTGSFPDSLRRLRAIAAWLRSEDPDAAVTDDMFTAAAAAVTGTPLYVLSHNAATLYRDPIIRAPTRGINVGQRLAARRFFYPTVWPPNGTDPPDVSRVPPVALQPPEDAEDPGPAEPGTVLVPSTYSSGFEALAEGLRDDGRRVTLIGDHDWGPVPSLLPVFRRADAVVCSGYSTVMEAAVAGTPCVVYPATNEQLGIADRVRDLTGFTVADAPGAVRDVLSEGALEAPEYTNGVSAISERVVDDLAA